MSATFIDTRKVMSATFIDTHLSAFFILFVDNHVFTGILINVN